MSQLTFVTRQRHGDKFWQRFASYAFAAQNSTAPLVAAEIPRAALAMPLAFTRQDDGYTLSAVLSIAPGQNMFVAPDGKWIGAYIPSVFRGYPLKLANAPDIKEPVLCVDEASGLVSSDSGEPFFDENGEIAKPLQDVLDFLKKVEENRKATDQAVNALADAGLITPWPLSLKIGDAEQQMPGLYKIDEAALNNTDDQTFLKFRRTGALPIAYAQLLSMGNVRFFHKLAQLRAQVKTQPKVDLDKLLGEDDIFKF